MWTEKLHGLPQFSSEFIAFNFQHRESVENPVSSTHHPRYRGWGDRLLSWPRPVWALSQSRGAPLGGRSWSQRHWALQSVPGEATALHQPGPGCTARLRNKQQPLCVRMNGPVCVCVCDVSEDVSMLCLYGRSTNFRQMCDFCHICVSLKQHTFRLFFQHDARFNNFLFQRWQQFLLHHQPHPPVGWSFTKPLTLELKLRHFLRTWEKFWTSTFKCFSHMD